MGVDRCQGGGGVFFVCYGLGGDGCIVLVSGATEPCPYCFGASGGCGWSACRGWVVVGGG